MRTAKILLQGGLKRTALRLLVVTLGVGGAVAAAAVPAQAFSQSCKNICSAGPVWADPGENKIYIWAWNNNVFAFVDWTVKDNGNGVVVGSGQVWPQDQDTRTISGLYSPAGYTLYIHRNNGGGGTISNDN